MFERLSIFEIAYMIALVTLLIFFAIMELKKFKSVKRTEADAKKFFEKELRPSIFVFNDAHLMLDKEIDNSEFFNIVAERDILKDALERIKSIDGINEKAYTIASIALNKLYLKRYTKGKSGI